MLYLRNILTNTRIQQDFKEDLQAIVANAENKLGDVNNQCKMYSFYLEI